MERFEKSASPVESFNKGPLSGIQRDKSEIIQQLIAITMKHVVTTIESCFIIKSLLIQHKLR